MIHCKCYLIYTGHTTNRDILSGVAKNNTFDRGDDNGERLSGKSKHGDKRCVVCVSGETRLCLNESI